MTVLKKELAPQEHSVLFYKYKEELYSSIQKYVLDGLKAGETVIMIADRFTCACIQHMPDEDCELVKAERDGKLLLFDSESMLAMFMNNGKPDPFLFERAMNKLLSQVPKGSKLRAYGDMVNLLCGKLQFEGAIELERLWNGLIKRHGFSLFCGYANDNFNSKNKKHLQHICEEHHISFN